jgi:hypothetical protein
VIIASMLAYQGTDPTAPYLALVIRRSAKLSQGLPLGGLGKQGDADCFWKLTLFPLLASNGITMKTNDFSA